MPTLDPNYIIICVHSRVLLLQQCSCYSDCTFPTLRQSLYDNEQNVQEHFAMFWEQVSKRFDGNPYILGELRKRRGGSF